MKKINTVTGIFIAILAALFLTTSLYAGKTVSDIIRMENKAYKKHTRTVLEFTHKKHIEDYKIGCGECHHDENNKKLDNLKIGDDVKNCIECHTKPDYIKGKKAKGLSRPEKRQYHANAIHDNCKGCHKDFNKKNKGKKAPTSCKACHPKK